MPENSPSPAPRDGQQTQDDNRTSGQSVVAGQASDDATQPADAPNYAANRDPAEGARQASDDQQRPQQRSRTKGKSHA
jgi:hypothetical protein